MSKLSNDDVNAVMGKRLAAVRESLGLTQDAFAEKLGISPRAYQNYERAEREPPTAFLMALYKKFKIDPLWIMDGHSDKPAQVSYRSSNLQLIENTVLLVEQHLANRRAKLTPEKKAGLVRLIYEHCMEAGEIDESHVKKLIFLTT